jgi:arylsulfatase A-like enzyme
MVNLGPDMPFNNILEAHQRGDVEVVKWEHHYSNATATAYMLGALQASLNYPRFLVFIHYQEPDRTGHHFCQGSPEYLDAIMECDDGLGAAMDFLRREGLADKTLVYVTTDHGFDRGSNKHANAPSCFLATNDPEVRRRGTEAALINLGVNRSNM